MDDHRFDALARAVATGRSRRGALRLLAGGALGGALAWIGLEDAAAACRAIGRKCAPGDRCCGGAKCKARRCKCTGGTTACNGACIAADRCCPGDTRSCYTGPDGTAGTGVCKAGTQTCNLDGTFGPCQDEVTPKECCTDDECDGAKTCQPDGTCGCPFPADAPCGQSGNFDVDACRCVCGSGAQRNCNSQCKPVCTPLRIAPGAPNGTYTCGGSAANGASCGDGQCCGGECCSGGTCENGTCKGGCFPGELC